MEHDDLEILQSHIHEIFAEVCADNRSLIAFVYKGTVGIMGKVGKTNLQVTVAEYKNGESYINVLKGFRRDSKRFVTEKLKLDVRDNDLAYNIYKESERQRLINKISKLIHEFYESAATTLK